MQDCAQRATRGAEEPELFLPLGCHFPKWTETLGIAADLIPGLGKLLLLRGTTQGKARSALSMLRLLCYANPVHAIDGRNIASARLHRSRGLVMSVATRLRVPPCLVAVGMSGALLGCFRNETSTTQGDPRKQPLDTAYLFRLSRRLRLVVPPAASAASDDHPVPCFGTHNPWRHATPPAPFPLRYRRCHCPRTACHCAQARCMGPVSPVAQRDNGRLGAPLDRWVRAQRGGEGIKRYRVAWMA